MPVRGALWLGRGHGSNGSRALSRGPRASTAARVWRASVALRRRVLGLVRAVTGGVRSVQAQLQAELHVELQVWPRWELGGVGRFVVRALLGRDQVRARPGAARQNVSAPSRRSRTSTLSLSHSNKLSQSVTVSQAGSQSSLSQRKKNLQSMLQRVIRKVVTTINFLWLL